MIQKSESKWQILREFLSGYIRENAQYRAGTIYEAYLNEGGSSKITRKDFEMFLRDQVMKDITDEYLESGVKKTVKKEKSTK